MTVDREQQLDEILAEYIERRESGIPVDAAEWICAHPDFADEIREFLADQEQLRGLADSVAKEVNPAQVAMDRIRYFGNYELLEVIAQGGMGIVYKAKQKNLNRIVAIKMIAAGHLASNEDQTRFQTEAEAAANLQHPNIVSVHEVGRHAGQSYFSMEFIDGKNLAEIVRSHPLAPSKAAKYAHDVALAIDYAHRQGTLHRDVKPSNILIDKHDQVQITDFGLATRVTGGSELTRSGQVLGTPSYMPPEQAQHDREQIGPTCDIYSTGAVLYELLTGRPPFQAESAVETLRQVIETEPPSPRLLNPAVPKDLETICLKCLQKEPRRRYAGANQLAADLQRFLSGEPILARPVRPAERTWRWCRRNPVVAVLSIALILAIVGGFGSVSYLLYQTNLLVADLHDRNEKLQQSQQQNLDLMVRLSNLAPRDAIPIFIEMLENDSPEYRLVAVTMIGRMETAGGPAVPRLIEALEDEEAEVRRVACVALGNIGPEARAAVPALKRIASKGQADTRPSALVALLQIDPKSDSRIREVMEVARGIFTRGERYNSAQIHRENSRLFRRLMETGIAKNVQFVSRVLNALQFEVHDVKQRVIFETSELDAAAVGELKDILTNAAESPEIQRDALWMIALFGSDAQSMANDVEALLTSANSGLRDMAKTALQRIAPARAAELDLRTFDPSGEIAASNRRRGLRDGDWGQLGGSPSRNNTPVASRLPVHNEIGRGATIKWKADVGQNYGNMAVANGKIFVGANNRAGYLEHYPPAVDLGVLQCFDEKTGEFLWQYSSPKLPTGRVHDWPEQGICSNPYVENDRVWFLSNRCELICLDTEGFHDGEDDGLAEASDPQWSQLFGLDLVLGQGSSVKIDPVLVNQFREHGIQISSDAVLERDQSENQWRLNVPSNGVTRSFRLTQLSNGHLVCEQRVDVVTAKRNVADVVWKFDLMEQLGVSPHNNCTSAPTVWGDAMFFCTSNGVDEAHQNLPAPDAPSFVAIDKRTAEVLWTDNSPGMNVLHGQWSSPAIGVFEGVPQVVFPGGDGWLYSFRADRWSDGKPELLWKFDGNPKTSKWDLAGRGNRNNIIGPPVLYDGLIYFAMGQGAQNGGGQGMLWCVDPTKRGDVSTTLVVDRDGNPVPRRRIQACMFDKHEREIPNPSSAAVWSFEASDFDRNGELDYGEDLGRATASPVIRDDLLIIADVDGFLHCLDAKTGKRYWVHDGLSSYQATPLLADGKVFIGDVDGDLTVLRLERKMEVLARTTMDDDFGSYLSQASNRPLVANGVLYVLTRTALYAIEAETPLRSTEPLNESR